jgi:hypothetical protein
MSGAVKGLDELTAEEEALLQQMQQEDASAPEPERASSQQTQPEAPPTAAPEPPAAAPEPELETDGVTSVPVKELVRERERRRQAEIAASELAAKHAADLARVQTRLEMLAQAAQGHLQQQQQPPAPVAPPQPPPTVPDYATDPIEAIKANFLSVQQALAQQSQQTEALRLWREEQQARERQQQERAELHSWGWNQEEEFKKTVPDYQAAVDHVRGLRAAYLRALGVTNPQQIQDGINSEAIQVATWARNNGMNMGRVVYDLARSTGYNPATVAPAAAAPAAAPLAMAGLPAAGGNGANGTAANSQSAVERLIRGQEMAMTIGSVGAAARGELAAETIANMPDADFMKLYEKTLVNPAAMRSLFGE